MTEKKTLIERIRQKLPSMRIRFLFLILFGSLLAAGVYVLIQSSVHLYVQKVYQSEEKRIERELGYVEELQNFITSNQTTLDSVDDISRWMREHRFVYLLIYKDNEIILTPDDEQTEEDDDTKDDETEDKGDGSEDESDVEPDGEGSSDLEGGETDSDGAPSDEEEDGENDGTEDDAANKEEDAPEDKNEEESTSPSKPGGITVDYPTREELYEYALSGESYPLILVDGGALSCSLAEYTEYFYYDMSNIVSFALALFVLAAILIVYFYKVTSRIARLAKDVSTVSAGAMNHTIRSGKNHDEIAVLCRNVEQMRSSIVETLEKERAAVNANTELITSMSHDIRTPLTVLLGYLDIVSTERDETARLQYIQAARQTANRLKNLSDEMFQYFLVFSDDPGSMECESYDAAPLLSQFFDEHTLLLCESGYELATHVEADFLKEACALVTNAPGCMRIVDNIFSNLTKYADKQQAVHLYFSEDDERVYIKIENAVRADKESVESTGIGLRTCERIAKNTGMLFEKTEEGDRFSVTLGISKAKGDEQ